jgi:UMF1 family MFS transporter
MARASRKIWGWWFFDWASQPYNTLLITFIFAPYMTELLGDGSRAQTVWGYGIGATGIVIALLAPLLGAVADKSGRRMRFIWLFSAMYVLGAWGLWYAAPNDFNLWLVMLSFAIGMIGMEFATIFTNAMLPDLGPADQIGRISGSGWAFGYLGGMAALIFMLTLLAENGAGETLIGLSPIFGLDAGLREGTRAVGPFTAIWYALFMLPFFLWVHEVRRPGMVSIATAARGAWPELRTTLRHLPKDRSLFAFLIASMFYRDALNGIYYFGGIYAVGVLGWSIVSVGMFGILGTITGATFAWLGGKADDRFGPKPVIVLNIVVLTLVALGVIYVSRGSVFGFAVAADSALPDIAFFALGGMIGAAGGALQSASRSMMVRQADPAKITESFGLYALTGKATSFIAPLSIAVVTQISGSQQIGITPLLVLFVLGLVLMAWVKPQGEVRA